MPFMNAKYLQLTMRFYYSFGRLGLIWDALKILLNHFGLDS